MLIRIYTLYDFRKQKLVNGTTDRSLFWFYTRIVVPLRNEKAFQERLRQEKIMLAEARKMNVQHREDIHQYAVDLLVWGLAGKIEPLKMTKGVLDE